MSEITEDQAKKAFETLASYGRQMYCEESRSQFSDYEASGLAVARMYYPASYQIAQMAYSAFEDINAHGTNCVLNWVYNLYPSRYESDLQAVKHCIEKTFEINTVRNDETLEWNTRKVRAIVSFEEVE
jgi:hypothetical protein